MASRVNRHVLRELSGAFGSEKNADCVIVFCKETDPLNVKDGLEIGTSKQVRLGHDSAAPGRSSDIFGVPLPAHRLVLQAASDRFAIQLERWSHPCASGRTKLEIPLGSRNEVTAASAALQYAYTGDVNAGSIRQALEIRQQGEYLKIKDCAADCDKFIERMLQPDRAALVNELHPESNSSLLQRDPSSSQQQQQPVLELYGCEALWPDPAAEPTFAAILDKAAALLVAHFGDALRTLNSPSLEEQLLALPAVGLEVLLGSNDFGTDDESSVLMLLAIWMKVNYGSTDEQTRQRLCRTVRLAQVNLPYRSAIVPALAADYESTPGHPAGWLPIGVTKACFATSLAALPTQHQSQLLDATKDDPWVRGSGRLLELSPRPQCIPPDGLCFSWHIDKEDLSQKLQQMQPGCKPRTLYVTFDRNSYDDVFTRGFLLNLRITVKWGQPAAGLYLGCELPSAFFVPGSRLHSGSRIKAVVPVDARVTVKRWQEGSQQDVVEVWDSSRHMVMVDGVWGFPEALRLLPQPAARDGGGGDGGNSLAAWAEYLKDGKISGTLTLMRPP